MNLVLGAAQVGLSYGVSNTKGLMTDHEAYMLLKSLPSLNIDLIDTAAVYGNSEEVIGKYSSKETRVITKIDPSIENNIDLSKSLWSSLENSLNKLNRDEIYAVLLHRSSLVSRNNIKVFKDFIRQIKSEGLVEKFGVSIYDPSELDLICNSLDIDIVQAPFNAFDQRLVKSGWLERLNSSGIEIHVRSIFLQGLLLMPLNSIPNYFSRWASEFSRWHKYIELMGCSPLKAALSTISNFDISHLVVGVNSLSELMDIVDKSNSFIKTDPYECLVDDLDLILPTNWKIN